MNHPISRSAFSLLLATLTLSPLALAGNTDSAAADKAIHIREETAARTVPITVTPSKKKYRVNENISFNVKGNEDYYLYVFNIDAATGESVLLIPNERTKSNLMHKGRVYKIPGTVEFFSDSPGTEQVVFVASKREIDLSGLTTERVGSFSKTNTKGLEEAFANKSIHVREARDEAGQDGSKLPEGVRIVPVKIAE